MTDLPLFPQPLLTEVSSGIGVDHLIGIAAFVIVLLLVAIAGGRSL